MATETESIPGTWTHQSREVKVPIGEDTDVLDQPPGYPAETIPAGFSRRRARVGTIGIDYVIGGSGPTLVLLHGYPQSWYEWRHIMPPDGYDKKTLAGDIHGLLVQIGHDKHIRLVGHDIGLMVAHAYAAAHSQGLVKLVLSEAFIPDTSVYTFPALTADGRGPWHFGFFLLSNGWFIDSIGVGKGAITANDVAVYAEHLRDPAHLRATLQWSAHGRKTSSTTPRTETPSSPCRCWPSGRRVASAISSPSTPGSTHPTSPASWSPTPDIGSAKSGPVNSARCLSTFCRPRKPGHDIVTEIAKGQAT